MTKPVLLTFSGTGVDMWTGYPADVARRVEDKWYFQPVAYPAATFPMGPSVDVGVREGVRLVLNEHRNATAFAIASYSQGSICAALLLDEFRHGALKAFEHRLIAGVAFGDPCREQGKAVGRDPGGRGISDKRINGTPDWYHQYADPMDLYTNVPNDDVGEDMTAIFRLVQLRSLLDLIGPDSLLEQVTEILTSPLREFPAMISAIVRGLVFVGAKPATASHIEYHLREAVPGVTYFDHAVQYLRDAA